jgi:hypothetical protein
VSNAYWSRNVPEEEQSYLGAMLSSPTNINIGLGAAVVSGVLAIPMGLAGAALPLVLFAAGETIASLFIPDSATFRSRVDRKRRHSRRQRARNHLVREISRATNERDPRWDVHYRMEERAAALAQIYANGNRALTEADVERTQDAAVDFLALWLVSVTMRTRLRALDPEELGRRKRAVQKRQEQNQSDRNLDQAAADLSDLERRRENLDSRLTAVETALLTLPDAVEEAYQAALAPAEAGETGQRLREAVERLEIERNIEESLDDSGHVESTAPQAARRPRLGQQS